MVLIFTQEQIMARRSKADWLRLIEEHKTSGLSAAEFCRRNKLNAKYFSLRRRKLTKTKAAFVELEPSPSSEAQVTVRITQITVPLADLRSVLSAL